MMRAKRQSLDYSAEERPTVSRWAARFSLLGGGTAWLFHLLAVYVISEFGCQVGWGHWIVGGLSMVAWLLLLATIFTGILAGIACWLAARTSERLRGAEGDDAVVPAETKRFIAGVSQILNGLFAFIIIVQGVPIFFFLRSC